MNIESFTPEVVSATSARRVSERKKVSNVVDKTFFKKTYKTKTQKVSQDTDNKPDSKGELSKAQESNSFSKAAQFLFPALKPDRRQNKTIQTYRAKKLKQMFKNEGALEEAIAKNKALGQNLLLLQQFKILAPNGKSIYALNRARDATGRFNNEVLLSKPHSSHLSTVDMRDDCRTETNTTTDGSILSLLSLDTPVGVRTKPGLCTFDFDTLFESSCHDHKVFDLTRHSETAASTNSQDTPAADNSNIWTKESTTVLPGDAVLGAKNRWGMKACYDLSSYSQNPCCIFNEPLEDDLVSMEDLFGNE